MEFPPPLRFQIQCNTWCIVHQLYQFGSGICWLKTSYQSFTLIMTHLKYQEDTCRPPMILDRFHQDSCCRIQSFREQTLCPYQKAHHLIHILGKFQVHHVDGKCLSEDTRLLLRQPSSKNKILCSTLQLIFEATGSEINFSVPM